eukprot:scpid51232/ scgid27515/ Probable proline racemase
MAMSCKFRTVDMHTCGEPLRIVVEGMPPIEGRTILEKRDFAKANLDHIRRFLMFEPRGHTDMYGCYLVEPSPPVPCVTEGDEVVSDDVKAEEKAHLAVLFLHNEGYSTMCGHAVLALARFAVDHKYVDPATAVTRCRHDDARPTAQPSAAQPAGDTAMVTASAESAAVECGVDAGGVREVPVNIECPCGLVRAHVEYNTARRRTGRARFRSVPAFVLHTDVYVNVPGYGSGRDASSHAAANSPGRVLLDVSYGGAFYALVDAAQVELDVRTASLELLKKAAAAIKAAVQASLPITHPYSPELSFLYGVIFTDGKDKWQQENDSGAPEPTANVTIFAEGEVDRSPTGSGVTARLAAQYHKGQIALQQQREFIQPQVKGSSFTGTVVAETLYGEKQQAAVIVEVCGKASYTGECVFHLEEDDNIGEGFLIS